MKFRRCLLLLLIALLSIHPYTRLERISRLQEMAKLEADRFEFSVAQLYLDLALREVIALYGSESWQATDARIDLREDLSRLAGWSDLELSMFAEAMDKSCEGNALYGSGRIREAGVLLVQAARDLSILLGTDHRITINVNRKLARLYIDAGDYGKAEPLLQRNLSINLKVKGEAHPETGHTLNSLAQVYQNMGAYGKAEALYQRSLSIYLKVKGEVHPETGHTLNSLAQVYQYMGAYEKAEPLYERSLAVSLKVRGEEHPDTAASYCNLASLYTLVAEYTKAEPFYRRCLAIHLKALGEEHPDSVTIYHNFAALYENMGEYRKAEPLYKRSLTIGLKVQGEEHLDTAIGYLGLARLYYKMGEYGKAEPLYQRSLAIRLKVLGEEHPYTAASYNGLADLYQEIGEYGKAEPLYQRSLAIRLKVLGEEHPDTAESYNKLAWLYQEIGEYEKAEPLCKHGLAIRLKVLGAEHPDTAKSYNTLAVLYYKMTQYGKAESLYQRILAIQLKVLGVEHPDVATNYNNLAVLYSRMRQYSKAEPLFMRSLAINLKMLGEEHPDTANIYNNLAGLYQNIGDYGRAELLFQRSIAINLKMQEEEHPDTANSQCLLALSYLAAIRNAEARPLALNALDSSLNQLERTFPILSERQKLHYQQSHDSGRDLWLSVTTAASPPPLASWIPLFGWKGQIQRYESFFQRASHDSVHQPLHAALVEATTNLATSQTLLQKASNHQRTVARERYDQALTAQDVASRALFAAVGPLSPPEQDARALPSHLPVGAALLDLQYYQRDEPDASQPRGLKTTPSYAAFILRPDRPAVRIELGPANAIDGPLFTWRKHMYGQCDACLDDAATLEQRLRSRVWEPLEAALEGSSTVFVSPDGELNGLPFSALPGKKPGSRLLEEQNIVLVPSPQMLPELLADVKAPASNATTGTSPRDSLVLVGDVDYDGGPGVSVADRLSRSGFRSLEAGLWKHLPQTGPEIDAVAQQFQKSGGSATVQILKGRAATEETIGSALSHAKQAHLATHGFYKAPPPDSKVRQGTFFLSMLDTDQPTGPAIAPGLRVGLVLAGANRVPEPGQDDGILTALELTSLDLRGLELITLSACETGLGDGFGGEGMVSLQRALHAAGAKRVVSSLWPVEDEATRLLMTRFYDNLWQKHMPAHAALREAQRWMLRESGFGQKAGDTSPVSPRYWAAFELSGDWR